MHKGISAAVVALSLAGCASTGTTPSTVTTSVNSVVSDIVGYAEAACAFQPDIASVLAIVTALYPGAAIASVPEQAVASTICGAVSSVTPVPVAASGRLRAASPIYYPGTNIAIHGTFLKAARYRRRAA